MSQTALKVSLVGVAFAVAGCAGTPNRTDNLPRQKVGVTWDVANTNVYLDPCEVVGIKPRPARYVSEQEKWDRRRAGEVSYFYNGWYLFAQKPFLERFASGFGAVAEDTIRERLANEKGCQDHIDRKVGAAPQPQPNIQLGSASDRPINATPRALDRGDGRYVEGVAPYRSSYSDLVPRR